MDEIKTAFKMYEDVFVFLKNSKSHESNKLSLNDPNRVEKDFSEVEKEHLKLLQTKVHLEIANSLNKNMIKNADENSKLSNKIYWLNWVVGIFTIIMALASVVELKDELDKWF